MSPSKLAFRSLPQLIAVTCAVAALFIGVRWGTFIGAGPDASGYVSQADMWARGTLTMPTPEWVRGARWNNAAYSSAPVGYRPGATASVLAPTYPPGLPMMMSLFERVGGRNGVFFVVPLLGALAVFASYLLGRRMAGEWAGAIAAALVVCSPPFLWMLIQPMSDVPATACWALALVFALRAGSVNASFAGIAAATAMLVRPNLAPLAVVPALLILLGPADRIRRFIAFAGITAAAAVIVGALNGYWYGSPLRSGYGSLSDLYALERVWPNVAQYGRWLVQWQTPIIFVGLAGAFFVHDNKLTLRQALVLTAAYPVLVLALYAPYLTFDHWTYLRFLLPAYPAIYAGVAAIFVESARQFRYRRVAVGVVALITVMLGYHGWSGATEQGLLHYGENNRRFTRAVNYVNALPQNAVLISLAYSGTLHFYTGRDVLRWEVINPNQLDDVLAYLRSRGHPLYFIGDPFEVDDFKRIFARADNVAALYDARLINLGAFMYDLSNPPPPAPSLASLSFNASTVAAGNPLVGSITLTRTAPLVGASVDLTSSDPDVVRVTRNMSVGPREMSATFRTETSSVSTPKSVTITASYRGVTRTAKIVVLPEPVEGDAP